MPFTLSHAAAALPFRRTRLVPSALLMGTFAPDLEYFIRLAAGGGWGHRFPGIFGMSLPFGLLALWIFHRLVKVPLVYLLPESVRARLTVELMPFRFGPPSRFVNIVVSLLIGIATHLLWDGLTHDQYWPASRLPLLRRPYHAPIMGWNSLTAILQIVSSVIGLVLLAFWCMHWYRRTAPDPRIPPNPLKPHHRHVVVAMGIAAAAFGALLRAWIGVGQPSNYVEWDLFTDQAIVTFGALTWWQLAMWGLLGPFRERRGSEEEMYMQARSTLQR